MSIRRASFEFGVPSLSGFFIHARSLKHLDPKIHVDRTRIVSFCNSAEHASEKTLLILQTHDRRSGLLHPFIKQAGARFATRRQHAANIFQRQSGLPELADALEPA